MPKTNRKNRSTNPRRLRVGDVVAIGWHDAISMDRVDWDELDDIEDPEMTRCWGAVVRKSKRYLYIASEIGDSESDSMWVEALPFRLIEECRIIDKTEI